jgi:RNA ligase
MKERNMKFPYIEHLDQVRDAIGDREEFSVMDKGGYTVANYAIKFDDTFPSLFDDVSEDEINRRAILREIRGITFDTHGKIIRRPFQKYFNYGEKPEEVKFFDISKNHVVFEKLDGSMIAPFVIKNNLHYGTKAGITDVSKLAERFVSSRKNYFDFSMEMISNDFTPMFEFVSRKQRIVIDYPDDNLILTGIRHMKSGEYFTIDQMLDVGTRFNIPVVKTYGRIDDILQFIDHTKSITGMEGYVVRFGGQMFKIKGDEYCHIHHTVSYFESEKNTVMMVLEDRVDDILPSLPDYKADKLKEFNDKIHHFIVQKLRDIEQVCASHVGKMTTKDFFGMVQNDSKFSKFYMSAFRAMEQGTYDFENLYKNYLSQVIRQCGTLTKINDNRHLIGGHVWDFHEH